MNSDNLRPQIANGRKMIGKAFVPSGPFNQQKNVSRWSPAQSPWSENQIMNKYVQDRFALKMKIPNGDKDTLESRRKFNRKIAAMGVGLMFSANDQALALDIPPLNDAMQMQPPAIEQRRELGPAQKEFEAYDKLIDKYSLMDDTQIAKFKELQKKAAEEYKLTVKKEQINQEWLNPGQQNQNGFFQNLGNFLDTFLITVFTINTIGFFGQILRGNQENGGGSNGNGANQQPDIKKQQDEIVVPTFDELTQAQRNDPEFYKKSFDDKNKVIREMRERQEANKAKLEQLYPETKKPTDTSQIQKPENNHNNNDNK